MTVTKTAGGQKADAPAEPSNIYIVSDVGANDHLKNQERLETRGLRYKFEKCSFAEPSVTYLSHTISNNGKSQGPNVNIILNIKKTSKFERTSLLSWGSSVLE